MNSENLNRWLGLIANFSVVIGIGFLIIEVRQNTDAIQLSSAQFVSSELANFNLNWTDPHLAELRLASQAGGYDSLTEVQKIQLHGIDSSYLQLTQGLYHQWTSGSLDDAIWNGRHRQLVELMPAENFQYSWSIWRIGASDDFRTFMEAVIFPEAGIQVPD